MVAAPSASDDEMGLLHLAIHARAVLHWLGHAATNSAWGAAPHRQG